MDADLIYGLGSAQTDMILIFGWGRLSWREGPQGLFWQLGLPYLSVKG
jgi:hypothetical protein